MVEVHVYKVFILKNGVQLISCGLPWQGRLGVYGMQETLPELKGPQGLQKILSLASAHVPSH